MKNIEILNGFRRPSDYVDSKLLVAETAASFTVPANALYAVISSTADIYADDTSTAVVPGVVSDGTAPERIPGGAVEPTKWLVTPGATISVISPTGSTPIVTISYYRA